MDTVGVFPDRVRGNVLDLSVIGPKCGSMAVKCPEKGREKEEEVWDALEILLCLLKGGKFLLDPNIARNRLEGGLRDNGSDIVEDAAPNWGALESKVHATEPSEGGANVVKLLDSEGVDD